MHYLESALGMYQLKGVIKNIMIIGYTYLKNKTNVEVFVRASLYLELCHLAMQS